MLEKLYEAERLLPDLLESPEGWTGLYAPSERPHLMRVWRQWGEDRIYLHEFGDCALSEVFAHPHPWASAIRILEGECEMGLAFGDDLETPPPVFCRTLLVAGSAYEITRPDGWHWVRPMGKGYRSIMVAGPTIWPKNRIRSNKPTRGLTAHEILAQLGRFQPHYPHQPRISAW